MNAPVGPPIRKFDPPKNEIETGDNCRNESLLRSHTARYTECNRKRESNYADYDAGNQIRRKGLAVILTFTEQAEEFRSEHIAKL